jgi:hypothetical protein
LDDGVVILGQPKVLAGVFSTERDKSQGFDLAIELQCSELPVHLRSGGVERLEVLYDAERSSPVEQSRDDPRRHQSS